MLLAPSDARPTGLSKKTSLRLILSVDSDSNAPKIIRTFSSTDLDLRSLTKSDGIKTALRNLKPSNDYYKKKKQTPWPLVRERTIPTSWLLTQRFVFDSRRYQIFWVAVGLERGPLSPCESKWGATWKKAMTITCSNSQRIQLNGILLEMLKMM
jgi:hypothetical protein